MRIMKYTALGLVFVMVACVSAIDIPTAGDLFICAGINQVYYDKILGRSTKMHKEVDVYFMKAVKMQPRDDVLSLLSFQEGMYQARVLNTDQLVSEIKRCQKLL